MQKTTIEIARVKNKSDIQPEDFEKALQSLDDFIGRQAGFISRQLGVDEQGRWCDIVHWQDLQSAKKAADQVMQSESCLAVFAMMDETSLEMTHVELTHSMIPEVVA